MNNYLRKFYYGDIPEDKAGGNIVSSEAKSDWPLWEVFIRSKQGLDHKHVIHIIQKFTSRTANSFTDHIRLVGMPEKKIWIIA